MSNNRSDDEPAYPTRARSLGVAEARSVEAVARLHFLTVERYAERRRLEWRVSLTIWAGLVIVATAIRDTEIGDPWSSAQWWLVLAGVFVIVVAHLTWEYWAIGPAADDDRLDGYLLDAQQRRMLGLPHSVKAQDETGKPRRDPHWLLSHGWQVGITLALAILVLVIGSSPPASAP